MQKHKVKPDNPNLCHVNLKTSKNHSITPNLRKKVSLKKNKVTQTLINFNYINKQQKTTKQKVFQVNNTNINNLSLQQRKKLFSSPQKITKRYSSLALDYNTSISSNILSQIQNNDTKQPIQQQQFFDENIFKNHELLPLPDNIPDEVYPVGPIRMLSPNKYKTIEGWFLIHKHRIQNNKKNIVT